MFSLKLFKFDITQWADLRKFVCDRITILSWYSVQDFGTVTTSWYYIKDSKCLAVI